MHAWLVSIARRTRAAAGAVLADTAGNAMAITAATIILLVSLTGSGTDMARAYMTKTSLQNACDAAVLAGRKAMTSTATYGTSEQAKANKMFNFNFQASRTNATNVSFTSQANTSGQVTGTASVVMPTVLMKIWGYNEIPVEVNCSAELQMASADVLFVLDTTGSMKCNTSGSNCVSGSDSKIVGLREAVRDFYRTTAAAVVDRNRTRIRFAFVPYTMTTNVSELVSTGAMPTSWLASTHNYQSRVANFNTAVYPANTPTTASPVTETFGSNITQTNCNNYGINRYPTTGNNPVVTTNAPPTANTSTQYAYLSWTRVSGSGNSALGTCRRTRTVTTTTYSTRYQFTSWTYRRQSYDVSSFIAGSSVPLVTSISSSATVPTAGTYDIQTLAGMVGQTGVSGLTTTSQTWNRCIEERATVNSLIGTTIPSGARDLDVTNAPTTDDATKWKVYLEGLTYWRGGNLTSYTAASPNSGYTPQTGYCPAPMKQFTTVDTSNPTTVPSWLDTYLNSLIADGGTYHDVGMIWGARLGNPNGMFASNVNAGNLPSVSRHIIFMTDGMMQPTYSSYSTYGTELYDNRIAPAGTTSTSNSSTTNENALAAYHNPRFLAACSLAKAMGYTVWVIGFGQTLTTEMTSCATASRAYYSSNTTELRNTFRYIAGQVADLRINQ